MDEMKIGSNFMKNLISKIARKAVFKKTGYNVDIQFNEISADMQEEKAHVHLNIDAEIGKEELVKILKSIGLD